MTRTLPGIGSHHGARSLTDEWLTPRNVLDDLGSFDLDPCAPVERPWPTATTHYTIENDGLEMPWHGRVWVNPPYTTVEPWLWKLAQHGHGTALVFARTETRWFFRTVWKEAAACLFLEGRLTFCRPDGLPSPTGYNSGGPSVLIAYGADDAERLRVCGLPGAYVYLWKTHG